MADFLTDVRTMTEENFFSLREAAGMLASPVAYQTAWRWSVKGVLGKNGERIKLRTIRQAGKALTTSAWLGEFLAAADTETKN